MPAALCEDVLAEIGTHISKTEQISLRAVCRDARQAIEPLFFAEAPIVLDIRQPRLEESLLHLDALASGKTSWARFGRTLRICYLSPGATGVGEELTDAEELRSANARTAHLLPLALQSMRNVHSVHWKIEATDDAVARDAVFAFLKTIEDLQELTIDDQTDTGAHYASLEVPATLRKLTIQIVRVDMSRFYDMKSFPQNLTEYRNARSREQDHYDAADGWTTRVVAKSARLEHLVPASRNTWQRIYIPLKSGAVRLKALLGVTVTQELVEYLASYSGLEEITATFDRYTEDLAHPFFTNHDGDWALGPYTLSIITQLPNLQSLELCLLLQDAVYHVASVKNLATFLDMTPGLPTLNSIFIRGTISRDQAGTHCGRNRHGMQQGSQYQINRIMVQHAASTTSPSVRRLIETHRQRNMYARYLQYWTSCAESEVRDFQ
ncbi:hypothetical protein B0H13DRAFT_1866977 [Mycena leptocephala]|nr:hypothetical protein B0H13DRAFT_1866977 [Mycena leptocephala]